MASPRLQALLDWMQQGAFFPERFSGAALIEYQAEAARIQRQWDMQPI